MPKRAAKARVRPVSDWRSALREYAQNLCRRVRSGTEPLTLSSGTDAFPEIARTALGDQAAIVQAIVEQLALGAAGSAADPRQTEAALDEQLSLVLEGIAPRLRRSVPANSSAPHGRPQLFQSDLWQLLHKVRESSELSFAREIDLVELDRRILFFLRQLGPLTPAGISAASGVDKAQVSRSIKRLLQLQLVERNQIRSPIAFTRQGAGLADRLARLAELRNRELTLDVGDEELAEFLGAVEVLLDRAVQLYDRERELSGARGQAETDFRAAYGLEQEQRAGEKIAVDRARLVSPLLTLMAYFSRSGALTFKRLTGLSNFEAWVLTEISYDPPTDWPRLVAALQRDHSQAGRTVNTLIEQGLVRREGRPGRRHGRFSPTGEGVALYQVIFETGQQRAEFLLAPLEPERLQRFMATFDKIRRNAAAQLERERTLRELETS
jgi:DNA-binding MarR family transcriptional regulator